MGQMSSIHVLLVDRHISVREGLASMLANQSDIEVVGQSASLQEAIQKTHELKPDILLVDNRLEGSGGIEICRVICNDVPGSRVIILTSFEDEDYYLKALQAGAWGYIVKTASPPEIVSAIQTVAAGKHFLSATIVDRLLFQIDQVSKRGEPS